MRAAVRAAGSSMACKGSGVRRYSGPMSLKRGEQLFRAHQQRFWSRRLLPGAISVQWHAYPACSLNCDG
jgi:hypothetical protein